MTGALSSWLIPLGTGVLVTWTNPPREPDLAGYALLRSRNPEQDYRPVHRQLLAPGTDSYRDTVAAPGTYFYRLVASDTAGNLSPMSVRAMAGVADSAVRPATEKSSATPTTRTGAEGTIGTSCPASIVRSRWALPIRTGSGSWVGATAAI